jgi:hypothetical protein
LKFSDFLWGTLPINILELIAAIAGTYFIKKVPFLKSTKYLVVFLWFTLIVEVIGAYPAIAHFSDYKYFSFVEGTLFERNYWIYNIYVILSYVFYIYYFRFYIRQRIWKLLLNYFAYIFIIATIVNLFLSDVFFEGISQFTALSGTLLIFLTVVIFYFELLRSDVLLNLKRFLPLYISIGILIYHLCVTPIDIFSEHFTSENPFYNQLSVKINLYANIFLYSIYILGFIICSRERRSY